MRAQIERALVQCECGPEGGTFVFTFPATDEVFKGHFPGHPILPGIFQLAMAKFACERVAGAELEVQSFSKAKFARPILPGERIHLSLRTQSADGAVQARATFTVAGDTAGSVSLSLGTPRPASPGPHQAERHGGQH